MSMSYIVLGIDGVHGAVNRGLRTLLSGEFLRQCGRMAIYCWPEYVSIHEARCYVYSRRQRPGIVLWRCMVEKALTLSFRPPNFLLVYGWDEGLVVVCN